MPLFPESEQVEGALGAFCAGFTGVKNCVMVPLAGFSADEDFEQAESLLCTLGLAFVGGSGGGGECEGEGNKNGFGDGLLASTLVSTFRAASGSLVANGIIFLGLMRFTKLRSSP